ncbi:MAG: serine/threonine-protein kinase [Tepidisphaeraceae bacterium]
MLQPKQRIGEYVLDEPLGRGAYGEVWKAHHHMWADQIAAVKVPTDPAYIHNLREQGIRVHRLVHPNIVHPIGFDPQADPPYLVNEYVSGGSLRPWVIKRRLSVTQAINILRQILAALQYGHERGIIHGDLKPDNILLDAAALNSEFSAPGCVKVTDFGVGVAAMATAAAAASPSASSTGAMWYIAPEQRLGAPADVKSDIFALGVVLFEMLTGERPSGAELPSELNPEVTPALDELFRKSYARRERRFETAQQFLDALPEEPGAQHRILRLADAPSEPKSPAAPASAAPPAAAPRTATAVADADIIEVAPPPPPPAARVRPPPPPAPEPVSAPVAPDASKPEQSEQAIAAQETGSAELDTATVDADAMAPTAGIAAAIQEDLAPPTIGPTLPPIPRQPSPAQENLLYDELAHRQVRSADDLRFALKSYFQGRQMDEGESANIRLRLIKWASVTGGGQSDLDQHIVLTEAWSRPLYLAQLLTRTLDQRQQSRSTAMDHPAAQLAVAHLHSEDYKLMAHLSGQRIDPSLLEAAPPGALRNGLVGLAQDAGRQFQGRIQRQDLLLFRSNAIVAHYEFDGQPYQAFLVGNNLTVLADSEPFTKIRQEPTKRATAMLDGEQIDQGIRELHRALDSAQWRGKAATILAAFRGKLAAAYMAEARQLFREFGWLESLEMSSRAGQLAPANDAPLLHAARVRKWVTRMQLLPGMVIAAVFVGLSVLWGLDVTPRDFKTVSLEILTHPFFAAGMAALLATLWSNRTLGVRMTRTDFAFYHAMLLPTAVAGVLALVAASPSPHPFLDRFYDILDGGGLLAVILADVLLFRCFRPQLIRPAPAGDFAGDELLVLSQIETLVQQDWERLRPHYLRLGPLYRFTGVRAATWEQAVLSGAADEDLSVEAGAEAPPPPTVFSSDPRVQQIAQQLSDRVSEAARALAPPTRMLITLANEYSKSVSNRQVALMQSNAAKIEQQGKELEARLVDFDRLCHEPPLAGDAQHARESQQIAQRLAARSDEPDIQFLRSMAERAIAFRDKQGNPVAELTAMIPKAQSVLDRLKQQ